jgi:hypothetical protein
LNIVYMRHLIAGLLDVDPLGPKTRQASVDSREFLRTGLTNSERLLQKAFHKIEIGFGLTSIPPNSHAGTTDLMW